MPLFDDRKEKELWDTKGHPVIKSVVCMLDNLLALLYFIDNNACPYQMAETCSGGFWRKSKMTTRGKKSFHPIYQAFDLRIKGMHQITIQVILGWLSWLRTVDKRIQHEFEGDHIHIEFDTGDPV